MKMAVAFLTDLKGYELARHSVLSFAATQSGDIDILIYARGFSPDDARLSLAVEKYGKKLYFDSVGDDDAYVLSSGSTRTMILKLEVLAKATERYDKVVYADTDLLFCGDIETEKIDITGFPVGAVYDIAEVGEITNPGFRENTRSNGRSVHYFNSGFLVVDSNKYRQEVREELFFDVALSKGSNCGYHLHCKLNDQCAFNRMFERNWKRLPLTLNLQACAIFSDRWSSARVRHYVGRKKFIPLLSHRTDRVAFDLISNIMGDLELPKPRMIGRGVAFELNVLLKRQYGNRINKVMADLDMLGAQQFD